MPVDAPHWAKPVCFTIALLASTITGLCSKTVYQNYSENSRGEVVLFAKPLTVTLIMFLGMTCALPIHFLVVWYMKSKPDSNLKKELTTPVGISQLSAYGAVAEDEASVPLRTYLLLFYPAIFDLVGTFLNNVGLLFVTVSLQRLVRCSMIVWVAILRVTVLGYHLKGFMWAGVALNMFGLVLVSIPTLVGGGGNEVHPIGLVFVLASCLVGALQFIFEEKMMAQEKAPPLIVVGMEGFWGVIITLIAMPIAYYLPGHDLGSMENDYDAFIMIKNSSVIKWGLFGYFSAILLLNVFAMLVTYLLDSLWRAIMANFGTIMVWVGSLMMYYMGTGQYGEPWTNWSYLQLVGMLVLIYGTGVYNGSITLSCFKYDTEEEQGLVKQPSSKFSIRVSEDLASNTAFESPMFVGNLIRSRRATSSAKYLYTPIGLEEENAAAQSKNYGTYGGK